MGWHTSWMSCSYYGPNSVGFYENWAYSKKEVQVCTDHAASDRERDEPYSLGTYLVRYRFPDHILTFHLQN